MSEYEAYKGVATGDKRISARIVKTLEDISGEPNGSILRTCGDIHQAKGVYRLIGNEKCKGEEITKVSREETGKKIRENGEKVIIAAQDTMAVDYSRLEETSGLGHIGPGGKSRGLMVHSAIGVGENGQTYGLLSQQIWSREGAERGKAKKRKSKSIEEKESKKWLEAIENIETAGEADEIKYIHICDREGDIYELLAKAAEIGATYICRRIQNRVVRDKNGEKELINEYIEKLPTAGITEVQVPRDSHTKREARTARLEIKHGKTTVMKPANTKRSDGILESVEVYVVSATEIDVPAGVKEPISWQLITNHAVESFEDALLCIKRYTMRWKIEIFHYTLKSGCAIEKLQISTASKLIKLIALYSVVALHIMFLTFLARANPDISCETEFTPHHWHILYKVSNKTSSIPDVPPTIFEAVIMIAKLGGFAARISDGFPGVTVIWRGLSKFSAILSAAVFLS